MGLPEPAAGATRAPRRDITALVRKVLDDAANETGGLGLTLTAAQIAERINARPSLVAAALDRIAKEPAQ
jgi:hypothetical protein